MTSNSDVTPDSLNLADRRPRREEFTPMTLLFLAAALAVRVLGITSASIWFDEAITRFRASVRLADYFAYFSDYTGTNLWELMLRPFALGPVWLLRIAPLIAAMIALWIAARLMDRLAFTRAQWITAAIPLILLPGLIWQAQDARYYAAVGAMYLAGLLFAIQGRWLGLLACMGLLPYLHPIGPAYALGLLVAALLCNIGLLRAAQVGALALLSWVPRLYQIVSTQSLPGLEIASPTGGEQTEFWLRTITPLYVIDQTGQALVVETLGFLGRLLLVVLVIFILAVAASRYKDRATRIILAAVLVPVVTMLAMTAIQPVYFYRPLQPLALPLCLLAGLVLAPRAGWLSTVAPAVGFVLLALSIANWSPSARGGYIEEGAGMIRRHWHAGDGIAYASITVAMPFQYYLPDSPSCLIPGNDMGEIPVQIRTMGECESIGKPGTWLVLPRDPTLNADLAASLTEITSELLPVWRTDIAWQFAPIEIYYLR